MQTREEAPTPPSPVAAPVQPRSQSNESSSPAEEEEEDENEPMRVVRSSSSPAEEEEEDESEPRFVAWSSDSDGIPDSLLGSRRPPFRPPSVSSGLSMEAQYDSGEDVDDKKVIIVIRWQVSGEVVANVNTIIDRSITVSHLWKWARRHWTRRHAPAPNDAELVFALKDDDDEPTPAGEPMTDESMEKRLFVCQSVRDRLRAKQAAEPDSIPVLDLTLMRRSVPNPTGRTNVIFD